MSNKTIAIGKNKASKALNDGERQLREAVGGRGFTRESGMLQTGLTELGVNYAANVNAVIVDAINAESQAALKTAQGQVNLARAEFSEDVDNQLQRLAVLSKAQDADLDNERRARLQDVNLSGDLELQKERAKNNNTLKQINKQTDIEVKRLNVAADVNKRKQLGQIETGGKSKLIQARAETDRLVTLIDTASKKAVQNIRIESQIDRAVKVADARLAAQTDVSGARLAAEQAVGAARLGAMTDKYAAIAQGEQADNAATLQILQLETLADSSNLTARATAKLNNLGQESNAKRVLVRERGLVRLQAASIGLNAKLTANQIGVAAKQQIAANQIALERTLTANDVSDNVSSLAIKTAAKTALLTAEISAQVGINGREANARLSNTNTIIAARQSATVLKSQTDIDILQTQIATQGSINTADLNNKLAILSSESQAELANERAKLSASALFDTSTTDVRLAQEALLSNADLDSIKVRLDAEQFASNKRVETDGEIAGLTAMTNARVRLIGRIADANIDLSNAYSESQRRVSDSDTRRTINQYNAQQWVKHVKYTG